MYKSEYQGHAFIELLTVQGTKPGDNWKFSDSSIKKVRDPHTQMYDRSVKGFVFRLEGPMTTTRMQLPRESKKNLALVQPFLGFQVHVPTKGDFSLETTITDSSGVKRRIVMSTVPRSLQVNPLHARTPLSLLKRGYYNNLVLDLRSLVPYFWSGRHFRSIEAISVSSTCRIRKVFTLNSRPDPNSPVDVIPRAISIPVDVPQTTQVVDASWFGDLGGGLSTPANNSSVAPPTKTPKCSRTQLAGSTPVSPRDPPFPKDYDQFAAEVFTDSLLLGPQPSDSFEATALATICEVSEEPDSSHHFSRGEDYSSSDDPSEIVVARGRPLSLEENFENSPHFSQPPSSPPILFSPSEDTPLPKTEQSSDLELVYDPCLECYYDPRTMKYYEIIN